MKQGIFNRPHSKYLWVSYVGPDGRMKRESSRTTKIREAEEFLHKRKQQVKEGKLEEIKKIRNCTFKELSFEYKKWAQRQRSYEKKEYVINQLVRIFGNYPLRNITLKVLEQYQTELMGQNKKPATINRHVATIKHMFTKAVEWDTASEDQLRRIRKVKQLEENNKRLNFLSKEDCEALINACASHLKPIVITALNTGMRKSEIINLTWDQVDMAHKFILIELTKNGERREIPINSTLMDTFKHINRRHDMPYVFHKDGNRIIGIRIAFDGACRRAGIKNFHFHDLRHTFASQLVMAGIDLTTVQKLLGHKTLSMTLRYSHLAPGHLTDALDVLDKTLNPKGAHLVHILGAAS